ncbi:hypothetical protein Taro_051602 [Colocasia esculenta]|uniref:Uncharacterized protein n=1 Tax=Colocasia esculenta TaxID=4460 RepID=A0A843XGD1_COLES|nr:hypothetical protein [Colocasia esculenta]
MDQYMEEKRAAQKRSVPPFLRTSDKKECPHCGRTQGGSECWKLAGKCLKCGSTEHQIRDYPRFQQFVQRGPPTTTAIATASEIFSKTCGFLWIDWEVDNYKLAVNLNLMATNVDVKFIVSRNL